ncbi:hypothetical protein C0J52_00716 [Blattella germanica]|nr:hypothetical protein C0J52_00716 [Blattella germanica]
MALAAVLLLHLSLLQRGMTDCTAEVSSDSPLILSPEGPRFVPANRHLQHGQKVFLACPGSGNTFVIQGVTQPYSEIVATCVKNNRLLVQGRRVLFRNITCSKPPEDSCDVLPESSEFVLEKGRLRPPFRSITKRHI